MSRRRVAIIGSGVSGLTAAYVLRREWDVTVYEADDRIGGHAHTHTVEDDGASHQVDSGFIVHNDRTYPLLRRTRVLEIGSGWGALAIRAAKRGAKVTTITLSAEQAALARERFAEAAVDVDLQLVDYREVSGEYDAIVSVEMIEAVGEDYWPTYFATIDQLLAPGGRVAIQPITMAHHRYLATRNSYGWIQKYIFPGGLVPSLEAIDETFRRMWEFYLAYCEAGFRTGYLDVNQLHMSRPAEG